MKHLKKITISACILGLILVLTGGCPATKEATLVGWVTDTSGNQLPLVAVNVPGAATIFTDGNGLFEIGKAEADRDMVAHFTLNGYASASRTARLAPNTMNTINITLKRLDGAQAIDNPSQGGQVTDGNGNGLTVGANGWALAGKKANGAVHVQLTALKPNDLTELAAFAGAFAAAGSTRRMIETYALANVNVTQDGKPVGLQGGAQAELRLTLPADTPSHVGDTLPLFVFDASAGVWVPSGTGTVEAGDSDTLVVAGHIGAFGWWCCGIVIENPYLIRGHVVDSSGTPIPNALVIASGKDYQGITVAVSAGDGAYEVPVKPEANVQVDLILPGAYFICDTLNLASGAAGQATENQDLSPDFKSCIKGHVTEADETTPVAGAIVYSSAGGTDVTAGDGSFCIAAPGSTHVAVYVLGRPPVGVVTPETATCDAGNGADVTLSVSYPKDGDRLGFVLSTLHTPVFGEQKSFGSMGLFYSGFKGDQFDGFNPDAPLDTAKVYNAAITPAFNLADFLGLLNNTLAFNLVFDIGFGVNEMFSLQDDQVPSIDKIGALDAGSPGTVSNGTDSVVMKRPLDYYYDFTGTSSLHDLGYAMLEPWMAGFYFQRPGQSTSSFDNGQSVTFAWPGGIDIGAFSGTVDIPGQLAVSAPTDLAHIFSTENLQNGLTVTWNTDGAGDYVTIVVETVLLDTAADEVRLGAIVCKAADDGSYTIPADTLAQLPQPAKNFSLQVNYLFAKRQNVTQVPAVLARGNGNGYVVLISGTEPVKMWGVDAHFSVSSGQPSAE